MGSIKQKLEETYNHILPYIHELEDLRKMCESCENYCGEIHDYAECKGKPCFSFYLGMHIWDDQIRLEDD